MTKRRAAVVVRLGAVAAGLLVGPLAAVAVADEAGGSMEVGALRDCAGIAAPERRLACYDALARAAGATVAHAVPRATPAPASPAATVSSGPGERSSPEAFGLTRRADPTVPPPLAAIEAHVARVDADANGGLRISLDNGQTWVTTEPAERLKSGDAVTIKRAALGSFLLTGPSRLAVHVRRLK